MKGLYSTPLRVYLCLALLAGVGIYSGIKLPISLFPNSTKPKVQVSLSYPGSTLEEFFQQYGSQLEEQLRGISTNGIEVEKITATYDVGSARYELEFKWGVKSNDALREAQTVANAFSARLPTEMRDSLQVWTWNRNAGFFALSFFSATRSLDELHALLEPVLLPRLARIEDADNPHLFNPNEKEVRLELIPEKMAALQLFPKDIEKGVVSALASYGGGSVSLGENQVAVVMPRSIHGVEEVSRILISTPGGRLVYLSDVAKINFGKRSSGEESFRTNGMESLILFARPKPDGNVKRMSEEMLAAVQKVLPSLPKDIEYRNLVDPSEFIRNSVKNVLHEVGIGAGLAVLILFLFIGSLRNTITAAIEIPLSMVLAFILMKLSGMNLNLISLGGLALSAGMNVDASVVVMENIFRHFEGHPGPLDAKKRLAIVVGAVKEVRFAVIASTIASLVVFLPLAFTSDLSYAILGDLAKTVVFSHGLSAVVALVLVPTVRLHLMAGEKGHAVHHSPIERPLRAVEAGYSKLLAKYLARPRLQNATYAVLVGAIAAMVVLLLPKLPREIIGKPDTDWMIISVDPRGFTLLKQMESRAEEVEFEVQKIVGDDLHYIFTQIQGPGSATIMARLRDKRRMKDVWKKLEARFVNTPDESYWVGPWNPSELPIPDPPDLRLSVRGGTSEVRRDWTQALKVFLEEKHVLPRIWSEPNVSHKERIVVRPNLALWSQLQQRQFAPADLADLLRVATQGKKVASLSVEDRRTDVMLGYPQGFVKDLEQVSAFPVGAGPKLLPLKALATVRFETVPPSLFREDGKDLFIVKGRRDQSDTTGPRLTAKETQDWVNRWKADQPAFASDSRITVEVEDSQKELHEALRQLGVAVALSVLLIFVTMVIQFGEFSSPILVLVAIPLGLIGAIGSLTVFGSTLSLNSVLGIILLNGIAVANSILLVDFMKREVKGGLAPAQAAVEAARKRLRPILITSLTTILGMLPIALGFGEGGKILQPLGITVSGGLWVSMLLTLFVVPALQVRYLNWKIRRKDSRRLTGTQKRSYGQWTIPRRPPPELTQ